MEKEQKYKFEFKLIDKDTVISDQNVSSFRFINYGNTDVVINNQLLLQRVQAGLPPFSFDENLSFGEKTAQQYKIVFKNVQGFVNLVQVIQKIAVNN